MRTLTEARRVCVLLILTNGYTFEPQEILVLNEDYSAVRVETIRQILRDLEREGLVEIDRSRRRVRVRLVPHPDIPWDRGADRVPLEEQDGKVREARRVA